MTQKDKKLLLKDLSARLSYGVKVSKVVEDWISDPRPIRSINLNNIIVEDGEFEDGTPDIDVWSYEEFKPYLFPLSSMTDEQKRAYNMMSLDADWVSNPHYNVPAYNVLDWLNENHLDYRDLISKGLALDATGLNIY